MMMEYVMNHLFMSGILVFGGISVLMQWLVNVSLKGYVKASANMKTTRKKIMINLKNQFETIYEMNYSVRNVSAYVDKYLLKLRFMGGTFSFWEKAPSLSAGLVTLIAAGCAFYTYISGGSTTVLVEILFSYGVVLACLFLFAHIFAVKSKKQQMHIQLVDYLENYLINRVTKGQDNSKEWKFLNFSMEEAFMEGTAKNEELKRVILEEEKELEKRGKANSDKKALEGVVELEVAAAKEPSEIELLEEFVQSFLA